ncbi:glutathione S-transferase family protein [Amaricoccus macauensis]|uniref:glutathione S-transferase family protein n=1 Tax=Amaricoccus macauensis TaxID=57001 RepID=UPI003C79F6B8
MGYLKDGEWHTGWYDTKSTGGKFERPQSSFRNWVTADGAPGPSGEGGFEAESGRYHLYVSYACPWAHRTLIMRALKGLEDHISVDVVHPYMGKDGWTFETDSEGATGDRLLDKSFLREIYVAADPKASTRVTVPVLWDKKRQTIVSNESAEIIRMLNSAFDEISGNHEDFYPEELRSEIDSVNDRVYDTVNNGVYKAGFATSQEAYDNAVQPLFETLDWLDDRLSRSRYLMGDALTEADVRLVTTLFRFDPVYHGHFKCNLHRLQDYPNLWPYTRELYQNPAIRGTVNFSHITRHYYQSQTTVNPSGIVPIGPEIDWDAPHSRDNAANARAADLQDA